MAKRGRPQRTARPSPKSTRASGRATSRASGKASAQGKPAKKPSARPATARPDAAEAPKEPRIFRLGAVPGATPGRWIDTWKHRMPHVELELVPIDAATQRDALHDLDAALVRLPLADDRLHVIPLYDEVPVVVASEESHLLAADELDPADLEGEVLITPLDDVLGPVQIPGTVAPAFAPLETTADAIATVASGVGIVIVPMSLARLHHRKDTGYRPLRGGPSSTVALAWPREGTNADVETFVGIVRGRTANSSRNS